ncbi:hypothetical protein PCH70_29680 [Pseudomonas cichorii JBC1]|nr:hypothetical protein PCH70_29680 [Pseudomonas cichorii JBC1]
MPFHIFLLTYTAPRPAPDRLRGGHLLHMLQECSQAEVSACLCGFAVQP